MLRQIRGGAPLVALGALCLPGGAPAQARWTIAETLRIGTPDEGPASFADIRGVAVGARGSIWVLDYKTQEIRLFDAAGKFVKQVARRGSGPGELRNANGLLAAPTGDIWANDPGNARFNVYSPEGSVRTQHAVSVWGYGYLWSAMFDRQGRLNEQLPVRRPDGASETRVRRFSADGAVRDTIPLPGCLTRGVDPEHAAFTARAKNGMMSMMVPFLPRAVMAWDPRGFVWCSGGDRYEVLRLALGSGDTARRIARDMRPLPVTAAERDSVVRSVRAAFAKYGAPDPDFGWIPKAKPVVVALDADDAGRVWVRATSADRTGTSFDVWNDQGQFVARAVAPFRISPYWHPLIRGDTLYAVTTDENDVPYVVRAVIRR